jgi:hypothetical protein
MMSNNSIRIPLRRVNNTLRIAVPINFKRKHGLTDRDEVEWTEGPDRITLRFLKVTKTEVVVVEPGEAAEAA